MSVTTWRRFRYRLSGAFIRCVTSPHSVGVLTVTNSVSGRCSGSVSAPSSRSSAASERSAAGSVTRVAIARIAAGESGSSSRFLFAGDDPFLDELSVSWNRELCEAFQQLPKFRWD